MSERFIVGRALRSGVADVRVMGEAEVGSDHHLILLKVRLQVKRRNNVQKQEDAC